MVAVPIFLGGAFGTVHYIRQSFVIYLKYQAFVDAYYLHTHPPIQEHKELAVNSTEIQTIAEPTQSVTSASNQQ